jgi:CheY-like chemotaxis protein
MKRSVLVIDDDETFLQLMKETLTAEGFKVQTAGSGQEGLELLKHHHVQLVITDMRMPIVDGYDVISSIKELYATIPIILTTANPVNDRVRKALQIERVLLMRKPFELGEFQKALASFRHSELPAYWAA